MRANLLSLALCLALPDIAFAQSRPAVPEAAAAAADAAANPVEFDRVVVSATRTERALVDVPNTVDVIDRERMDALIVRDLKDLFRYQPGITVTEGFGRFGIGDIRIRGLGGNRVRIQVDDIPVSDAFAIGSFSNANRNFVDLDTLKRVEVLRGPGSSLYGSDALGGTVSFVTKDPSDYLKEGRDAYFGFRLGFQGDNNGLFGATTTAFGGERWLGLVAIGHRQGETRENQGTRGGEGNTRTQPNPQDSDGRSLLTKLLYAPSQDQRFRLTVEGNEDRVDTEVLSARGFQPFTRATNLRVAASDEQTRARVSFGHEWDALNAGFADSLDWQAYRQDSETTQDTLEERTLAPPVLRDRRERTFNFDQRLYGVQANLRKQFDLRTVRHTLSYGLEVERIDTRQKRDGRRSFPLTGVVTPVLLPDVLPVRDFPISQTTEAGLYVQDEIELADGRLRLIPALRADYYRLEPDVDNIFREDNPGVAVSKLSESNLSPKLGAVWRLAPQWSLFGGYARGFRSPPYNDVNIGFTNTAFGYTAIANSDLKPETSDGLEAGVRYFGTAAHAGLSGYINRYRDFIESLRFIGFDPTLGPSGLSVFQSQNVSDARIYGLETRFGVDFGRLSETWSGWSLRGAAAWSRGEDRTANMPLDSVDPLTASLGVAWKRGTWGAELAGRFVDRKRRSSDDQLFRQPGYGVLDLYAHWGFTPGARIDVGVFNLADRRYILAGDLPQVQATSTTLERFTAPGRNLAVSISVEW